MSESEKQKKIADYIRLLIIAKIAELVAQYKR